MVGSGLALRRSGYRRFALAIGLLVHDEIPTSASSLTVPTQVPTIQEALDARPDTVYVQPGRYAETPVVSHPSVLIGLRGGADPDRPVVEGLWFVTAPLLQTLHFFMHNLEFTGEVHIRNDEPAFFEFSACRFRRGFFEWSRYLETEWLRFTGCELEGEAWVAADGFCVLDSCVIRGQVIAGDGNCRLVVRRCLFEGSGSGRGLDLRVSSIHSATIESCTIERYESGIIVTAEDSMLIRNSVVRECGLGIHAASYHLLIEGNLVEGCSGFGIQTYSNKLKLLENRVLACGWDGMIAVTGDEAVIVGNVAAGNALNGLRLGVDDYFIKVHVINNTFVRNQQAGILSGGGSVPLSYPGPEYRMAHNVSAFNGTYGLQWIDSSATVSGCNAWFGNGQRSVGGGEPSPTDVLIEPRFCDAENGDYRLQGRSQLLGWEGCGRIGALGMGCDSTSSAVYVSRFEAGRNGATVRVSWQLNGGLGSEDAWVERSEQSDGPWSRIQGKRARENGIVTEFDETALLDRVYWYRMVGMLAGTPTVLTAARWVGRGISPTFRLELSGPNPAGGPTTMRFALPSPSEVELDVFDIQGRKVSSLVRGFFPAGEHAVEWNGRHASGLYIVRYRYPGGQETRRLIRTS